MNHSNTLIYFLSYLFLIGCSSNESKKENSSPRIKSISKIDAPTNGTQIIIGDTIEFKITINDPSVALDSVVISYEGKKVNNNKLAWHTHNESPGQKYLLANIYLNNGTVEKKRHTVTLLSDIEPQKYTYRITNTFVHDPDAFTQGLILEDGKMYESTGEKGQSTVRQVELNSGKVLKSTNISAQYFGEGIGIFGNEIYMLSWKERTGFVYNKETLELTRQFSYPTEGWGLTSNNKNLIMSDGTHVIRFMEPESFTEVKQIEVYDQNGPVDYLNELEYINGDIFAVRWQTELIYIIDPSNGKVKGILDLEGIFDYSLYDRRIDVLNGIAYDPIKDRYYITGKWWPKLFEIQLVAANNT